MKGRPSAKSVSLKNTELGRVVDGLKMINAILLLEKRKPDPERSRPLVFSAQETADVLIRRLDELR